MELGLRATDKIDIHQPELLSEQCLLEILNQRGLDAGNLEKNGLVELYYKNVLPLPQRTYRQNRRGRQMTAQQVDVAQKRRRDVDDISKQEPPVKKGCRLLSSFTMAASSARLKPPPSAVNYENKIISLTKSSGAMKDKHGCKSIVDSMSLIVVRSRPADINSISSSVTQLNLSPASTVGNLQSRKVADLRWASAKTRDPAVDFQINLRPSTTKPVTATRTRVKLCRSVDLTSYGSSCSQLIDPAPKSGNTLSTDSCTDLNTASALNKTHITERQLTTAKDNFIGCKTSKPVDSGASGDMKRKINIINKTLTDRAHSDKNQIQYVEKSPGTQIINQSLKVCKLNSPSTPAQRDTKVVRRQSVDRRKSGDVRRRTLDLINRTLGGSTNTAGNKTRTVERSTQKQEKEVIKTTNNSNETNKKLQTAAILWP